MSFSILYIVKFGCTFLSGIWRENALYFDLVVNKIIKLIYFLISTNKMCVQHGNLGQSSFWDWSWRIFYGETVPISISYKPFCTGPQCIQEQDYDMSLHGTWTPHTYSVSIIHQWCPLKNWRIYKSWSIENLWYIYKYSVK